MTARTVSTKPKTRPHHWPHDTAGRRMTSNVPTATPDQTTRNVQKEIEAHIHHLDSINYIYIVDTQRKFLGVLSIRDLYRTHDGKKIERIYKRTSLISVKPETDQEKVAYLALKNNIKAIPVVDHDGTFLGAIPNDVILGILYKETHEDLMRRAGVHHAHPAFDNVLTLPLWESLRHRLPWLFVGLLGGIFTAQVIGFFEKTLEENIILAAFIPLIVYMSGAVGTQMEAFIIRDLAINHHLPFFRYVFKQLMVIGTLGILFGALLFGVGSYLFSETQISMVLGVSLTAATISSVFTGLIVPYVFNKLNVDPATASGPIATIIQDLLSIIIYFSIASLLL